MFQDNANVIDKGNNTQNVCQRKRLFKQRTRLLKDCSRADLTSREAKLYEVAKNLLKRKRYADVQISKLQKCLKNNQFVNNSDFIKKIKDSQKLKKY